MSPSHRLCLFLLLLTAVAAPAAGQRLASSPSQPDDWRHCTIVTAAGGIATDTSDPGAAAGGAIGWEIFPRVGVEGSALWTEDAAGLDGFNAAMKLRAGFRQTGISPFVEGGVGLYHVSTTSASDKVPEFYARRMATATSRTLTQSFTDPAFHIGAGVNIFVSRHFALQPAIEAMIVPADSQTFTMTMVMVRLGYHFEDHRVR
jgi:hypothetical protein